MHTDVWPGGGKKFGKLFLIKPDITIHINIKKWSQIKVMASSKVSAMRIWYERSPRATGTIWCNMMVSLFLRRSTRY